VQELKEQLRAERSWWQGTSAAQVTMQVVQFQKDLETQQVTLAGIAEHLLHSSGLPVSIDETPQVQAMQAVLEDLKIGLSQQQQAQEIQANALRDCLMEIHEQRTALAKVEGHMKEVMDDAQGRALGVAPAAGADLQAWVTAELDKMRWEVQEAERDSRTRELTELRAAVEVRSTKALEIHDQLADELANVNRRCEEQRIGLNQAVETERLARINEASELRAIFNVSSVAGAVQCTPAKFSDTALAQLRHDVAEDRAQNIREASNAKAIVDRKVESLMERTNHLSKKLGTTHGELELLRVELEARLVDVEMKLRDGGKMPFQPRADGEELAARLEAIKAQLRSEIEKRIEPILPTVSELERAAPGQQ